MAIAGGRPEAGVRIEIERAPDGAGPWEYRGRAVTPSATFDVRVLLSDVGGVDVELPEAAPSRLSDKIRLIVRAAWKHARDDGAPPPRALVRWRAEI